MVEKILLKISQDRKRLSHKVTCLFVSAASFWLITCENNCNIATQSTVQRRTSLELHMESE